MKLDNALSLIREIPDYPQPGILFRDITPLLADQSAFAVVTESLLSFDKAASHIAGIEARGFIFASAVANQLRSGFVPIRKAGKLPHLTISESYGLEYGVDTLEVHIDAVAPGSKVLLIDDVLATGGTIAAAIELIQRLGGQVTHVLALLEISGLPGRERLNQKYPEIQVTSLLVS